MKRFSQVLVIALLAALLPSLFSASHADAQTGNSIVVLHVVPDGVTPSANMAARTRNTINAVQDFLRDDVGRTLRVTPGITQVSVTNGSAASIRNQLIGKGYDDTTIYLVFADAAGSGEGCGVTFPRIDQPTFAFLLMPACDIYPGSGPQTWPYNATYLTLHELLHGLGAVPSCAPNATNGGHVDDSARDILSAIGRDWDNLTIDVNNDDYYNHNNPGCTDIADSPFWVGGGSTAMCAGKAVTIDMNTNGGNGVGTAGNDVIRGTAGADIIDGQGGHDTICAGDGDDDVSGGFGADEILGQGGDDDIYGQQGSDTIDGGSGNNRVWGQGGDDDITTHGGNDALRGGAGDDELNAGAGGDLLFGNSGNDRLLGGDDNDRLRGQASADQLYGQNGNDLVVGGGGVDTHDGGSGNDRCLEGASQGLSETYTSCERQG